MRTKIHLLALSLVIVFVFRAENVKGENNPLYADSTCCAPDSLTFIRATYPVFCVSWHVPSDSACLHPQGFEVQWKLLTASIWKSKTIAILRGLSLLFVIRLIPAAPINGVSERNAATVRIAIGLTEKNLLSSVVSGVWPWFRLFP